MKRSTIFAAIVILPVAAAAAEIEQIPKGQSDLDEKSCDVVTEFASACCGIDQKTFEAVGGYVKSSRNVVRARLYSWGREGEKTFCLTARTQGLKRRVYREIRAILPAPPKPGSPVTVRMP